MKVERNHLIIGLIVCTVAWIIGLGIALNGCAVAAPKKLHGSVPISLEAPTLVLTGPARGHWGEESEHPVVAYTVPGTDCKALAKASTPEIEFHGEILLAANESLCFLPLRANQRVLFHATQP